MIPLKLQIKNFLSFGADIQTIDFTPYSLICLSGKNGHGKSALLDAMTWALWGQGRKMSGTAKSDDAMVRIGQTHMMVGMQFMCNGQEYRVRREYTRSSSKPYVTLDVGIFDSVQQAFIPIGGKSIRSNQAALEQLIHLDFETFCNSAFLRQGQSNEFSKKSPKDRKEILAAILGLNEYESIRALASEYARTAATSRISMQAILDRMVQDVSVITEIDQRLNLLNQTFAHLQEQEVTITKQDQELAARRTMQREQLQKLHLIDMQIVELQKVEKDAQKQLLDLVGMWRAVHVQQLKVPALQELETSKSLIGGRLKKYQEAMHVHLVHKEKYLRQKELVQKLKYEHAQLSATRLQEQSVEFERTKMELEQYKSMMVASDARLSGFVQQHAVAEEEFKSLLERQKVAQVDPQLYATVVTQFEKRKAFYQNWITMGNLLAVELQNMDRKKQLSQDETNPCCPLCEQNLSASRRKFLKDKFMREEHFLRHRIARITRVVQKIKLLLIDQHAQLGALDKQKDEAQKVAVLIDGAKAKLLTIAQEIDTCGQQKKICERQITLFAAAAINQEKVLNLQKESAQATLLEDAVYKEAVNQLQILEKNVNDSAFDGTAHEQLRIELEAIEEQIKSYNELTKQIALQDTRQEQIHALVLQLKKIKQDYSALNTQKMAHQSGLLPEDQLVQSEQELNNIKTAACQQRESLLQERGGLERERAKLKALEQEAQACQRQVDEINMRIDDYQAIASATGKDGIQALLIQDILPEIEQEANELLAKLTDNQAQIFIESLRDLKKGGAKETLDINISDTMGIRPYEMFSGGEAFRIDFAIRIALSKMLARRAGTSLQTLIIDEGFGSQDEEGLAHIMDALYKIQDDFAKIIIVSHLPSMKDQFPVHFHVEKKPTGSVVNIIEQG
jgi:exonuclease SbcC